MGTLPRLALLLALTIAVAASTGLLAAPADAATGVKYGITDDAWLQSGPGTLESRLTQLHTLGVGVVRFTLNWNLIAPVRPASAADPEDAAYDWSKVDPVLEGLRAQGITIVLQLNGAPTWANGGRPANYAPASATTFRDFATAAATRYSWVKRWLVWNEPNQVRWLRSTSASVYTTRLLNPAYAAIHAVIKGGAKVDLDALPQQKLLTAELPPPLEEEAVFKPFLHHGARMPGCPSCIAGWH